MASGMAEIKVTSGFVYGQCEDCIFWRDEYEVGWQAAIRSLEIGRDLDETHGTCQASPPTIDRDGRTQLPITQGTNGCGCFQDLRNYHVRLRQPIEMKPNGEETRKSTTQPTAEESRWLDENEIAGSDQAATAGTDAENEGDEITDAELEIIWRRLSGTTNNVYRVAQFVLGREVDDSIFDALEKRLNVFHCECCSMWLPMAHCATGDMCIGCHDEIGEDDLD